MRIAKRLYSTIPEKKLKYIPLKGVYPSGFSVGAIATKVKKSGVNDLCIVHSSLPCVASGVFTTNAFCAAPVTVSKISILKPVSNLVVNSGCANACTGELGLKNASIMMDGTLVMSTGVIGQHLQMNKITTGITDCSQNLGSTHEHVPKGIMTTDTFPKLISKQFTTSNGVYTISGWSKGAGMIHPNMATMLAGIFTDAKVTKNSLDGAVKRISDVSFNAISIDGDTSTNDTFVVMANGASGVNVEGYMEQFKEFEGNLESVAVDLAKLIVRDGEGATKFVEVHVKGASSKQDAKTVATTIATSPLVKTAIYGKDANWGRIVCAVGYSGIKINPDLVNLHLGSNAGSLHLFKDGMPFEINEEKASLVLDQEDIFVTVELGLGTDEFKMYTCDFSHEYVSINADYRS